MSCDYLPADGNHYQGDVLDVIGDGWDMMIAHPPCTHLAVSGARWFHRKRRLQTEAIEFVDRLWNADIIRIVIENPIGILSSRWRKPDQIVQPYYFGDRYEKRTCLWLQGVKLLQPTKIVTPPRRMITRGGKSLPAWYGALLPGPNRQAIRSQTFPGMADAMARQWG